jgi:oxygen-dependent protoporphyrinogen oxidase
VIIVAGGGPSGLAAAFRLQQAGHKVRVLEAADRPGSKMCSVRRDGYLLDKGAYFIPTTHRNLLALARDAGLDGELVPGGFVFGLVRDGEIHEIDGDHLVSAFARTPALSARAKLAALRLAPEALRARKATVERIAEAGVYDDATLGDWADATLSRELSGQLISAAIRSIYGIEADDVSRVELLGILALFKGAKLVAFRGGMEAYASGLAAQLDVTVGAQVLEVRQRDDGAQVTWRDAEGEHVEHVAGCVVALNAPVAADVRSDLDAWRAAYMRRVRCGPLVTPNIALDRRPEKPGATYSMIARREHPYLGGILCDHHKAPGRVPEGKGLVTLTLMTDWCERHWDADDDAIVEQALVAVEHFLPGTADQVRFAEISRWTQQYAPVGHYAGLAEFRARSAREDRSVVLCGEYLSAPQLSAATASGEAAAAALAARL